MTNADSRKKRMDSVCSPRKGSAIGKSGSKTVIAGGRPIVTPINLSRPSLESMLWPATLGNFTYRTRYTPTKLDSVSPDQARADSGDSLLDGVQSRMQNELRLKMRAKSGNHFFPVSMGKTHIQEDSNCVPGSRHSATVGHRGVELGLTNSQRLRRFIKRVIKSEANL